ncbi:MAG: hypothetical protein QNJ46_15585 [Leptolyngbyaceae cyanobacterium MO_188.B28]|nr:hypothetical protein [Leptolyngbyaceae cyanobacterium MO_188.B28]
MTASILTNTTSLEVLAQRIHLFLADQASGATALNIRCVLSRGKLMVLGEHPKEIRVESELMLLTLKQAIHFHLPEIEALILEPERPISLDELPVQLYLRVLGQKRPYACHRFLWPLKRASGALSEEGLSDEGFSSEVRVENAPLYPQSSSSVQSSPSEDPLDSENLNSGSINFEILNSESANSEPVDSESGNSGPVDFKSVHFAPINSEFLNSETELEPTLGENNANSKLIETFLFPRWLKSVSQQLLGVPRWMIGGVAGVFALGGVVYGLSGPCVIGRCEQLSTAQTLNRSALALLSEQPSPEDILEANQELKRAIKLLTSIPSWSRLHAAAQSDLSDYQQHSQAVEQLIEAQKRATLASQKSQNPPHPIQHWVGVRMRWRQAIALLKQIPEDSLVYELGQKKLAEYNQNLAEIEARIQAEQAAESTLDGARQTGQLALHRTETADSFPGWQLAYKDWRDAVNSLQRIPQGTMAYDEAQELLANYRRYSAMASDRTRQERIAEQIYNQAQNSAHQARDFEQQNQWTLAVTHWRKALAQIQKVPSSSTIHADAQAWAAPYRNALSQAEVNLRTAIALQKVEKELNQACGGAPPICQYIPAASNIRINVAAGYDYAIEQSMTPPPLRGNTSLINPTIAQQANSLLQTIATVGVNAQMPIELYNSRGQLLARYVPSLAGFVKH